MGTVCGIGAIRGTGTVNSTGTANSIGTTRCIDTVRGISTFHSISTVHSISVVHSTSLPHKILRRLLLNPRMKLREVRHQILNWRIRKLDPALQNSKNRPSRKRASKPMLQTASRPTKHLRGFKIRTRDAIGKTLGKRSVIGRQKRTQKPFVLGEHGKSRWNQVFIQSSRCQYSLCRGNARSPHIIEKLIDHRRIQLGNTRMMQIKRVPANARTLTHCTYGNSSYGSLRNKLHKCRAQRALGSHVPQVFGVCHTFHPTRYVTNPPHVPLTLHITRD